MQILSDKNLSSYKYHLIKTNIFAPKLQTIVSKMTDLHSSKAISALRFPLAMLVLFVHCHAENFQYAQPPSQWGDVSFGEMFYSLVAYTLAWSGPVAVPAFFLLSGYLFFVNISDQWSWDTYRIKLTKRIRTLLIPYLLFNGIATVSSLYFGDPTWRNDSMIPWIGYFWNSTTFCVGMHNWMGLDMQLFYPEVIPLWYMRDLMFMCIISPLIWLLLVKWPRITLSLLLAFYLSGLWIGANGYNSQALAFFSIGACFAIHNKDMMVWCRRYLTPLAIASLAMLTIVVKCNSLTHAQQLNHFFYLCSSLTLMGLAMLGTEGGKSFPKLLTESSFFVYSSHMCIVGGWSILSLAPHCLQEIFGAPDGFVNAMSQLLLGPLFILACCLVIYLLLKKCCNPMFILLNGGRK